LDISFSSSLSGVRTAIQRNDLAAHDVANSATPGFEERVPSQVENTPWGTKISRIGATPNPHAGYSNTDLAVETAEQIQNKTTLSANLKAIQVKDNMLGEIIDLVG
jgi:flagellar hook protein FlgE